MTVPRTILRALGVAVLLLFGNLSAFAVEAPVRIMPLGDSLTYGVANTSVQGGYRNRLYSLLTSAGYHVDFVGTFSDTNNPGLPDKDHQGLPGSRTDQILGEIDGWLDSIDDPDVVLLLIGTNDIWQNHLYPGNFPLAQTEANLSDLIATIATRRPFAKIIVSNLPQRTDNPSIETAQQAYNADLPGIVAQHVSLGRQVSLVDMHSVLTPFDLSSDGVHPSTAGYQKMADTWLPAISNVISPQGSSNPPLIARVGPLEDLTHVSLVFSKPLADDAIQLGNFSISGGLTVSNAVLDPATKRTITLTTSPQTPGVRYSISVSGVRDRTAQQTPIAPHSMVEFAQDAVTNGSFEDGFTGWSVAGNMEIQDGSPYSATDGAQLVSFNSGNDTPNGVLSQSFPTMAGRTYRLEFDYGVLAFNNNPQDLHVHVQGATQRLSELLTAQKSGASAIKWIPKSYTFIADSPSTTLTFTDISDFTNSIDLLLDHVRVQMLETPTLSVTSSLESGVNVTISPNDIVGNSDGTTGLLRSYNSGTEITVTVPASSGASSFLHWQINGVDLPGSSPATSVTLHGNVALTAVYEPGGSPVAPVATSDAYSHAEDTPLVVAAPGVLANDTDGNALPLTAVQDDGPAHGSLDLNPNGGFTYTPAQDYHGADSFSYHANNGELDSETVTVSITVTPVNDPPLAVDDGSAESPFLTVDEDSETISSIAVLSNDTDPDLDPLTIASAESSSGEVVIGIDETTLSFTPAPDFNGPATISYTITDGQGGSASATAYLMVTPANDAPVAAPQSASTTEGTPLEITLTGSDIDGDPLTAFTVTAAPQHGTLTGTAPDLTYTPAANFHGPDSFSFTVSDGQLTSTASVVSLTVNPINDPPVANAQSLTTDEDIALPITLTGSDPDDDPLTEFTVTVSPQHGSLSGTAPNLTYTPAANYHGSDSFSFTVTDGQLTSAAAVVSLTINPVNDPPIANAQSLATNEDTALPITLTGSDVEGDPLTAFTVTVSPQHGTLTGTAPDLTYTPAENYHGPDQLTFTVSDGLLTSVEAVVSITVDPVNVPPIANAQTLSTNEDTSLPITLTGSDPDGDSLTAFNVTSNPQHGTLSGTAPDLIYTPAENFHGPDQLTFTVSDGLHTSIEAVIAITVDPVNDAPIATPQTLSVNEDTALPITLTGSDPDGDPVTGFTIAEPPLHGTLTGTPPNLTYTPDANYLGPDQFSFTVSDGALDSEEPAVISITVNPLTLFAQWQAGFGLAAPAGEDSDGDGIANVLEYVLGGNPANQPDNDLQPSGFLINGLTGEAVEPFDHLVFAFRRTQAANTDPDLSIGVEWSTDPSGVWTDASGTEGAFVIEETDDLEPEIDQVYVALPLTLAPGGKLFARLKITIADP